MSRNAHILLDSPPPARNDARKGTENLCSANWRLARSGATNNMSRPAKAFAVPIRCITAGLAVRATPNTRSATTGCGAPSPSSGNACATAKQPILKSARPALCIRSGSPMNNVQSWNAGAKQTSGAAADPIAARPATAAGGPCLAAGVPRLPTTAASTSTPVTGISGAGAATRVLATSAPAATSLNGACA